MRETPKPLPRTLTTSSPLHDTPSDINTGPSNIEKRKSNTFIDDFNLRKNTNAIIKQTDKSNFDLPGPPPPSGLKTAKTANDNITADWMQRHHVTPNQEDSRRKSNSLEKALNTSRKENAGIHRSDSAASRLSQNIFNQKPSNNPTGNKSSNYTEPKVRPFLFSVFLF